MQRQLDRHESQATLAGLHLSARASAINRRLLGLVRRNPLGTVGFALVVVIVVVAALGPSLVGDPAKLSDARLAGPSSGHWFGTDNLGRDYFTRIIAGTRGSITLAVLAATIGISSALLIGTVSTYLGGVVDLAVQRVVDILLAFPGLILLMLIGQALGRSSGSIAIGLGLIYTSGLIRVVRSYVLTTRAQPYVESARVVGAAPVRLLCRHILPNLLAPMLIYASAVVSGALLAEGGLAFLGLGVRPPAPSWGRMLAEGRTQWHTPYLSIFPGVAITAAVLGFSLLGDSLRDELDPRLRHR